LVPSTSEWPVKLLAAFVGEASDAQLERRFGSRAAQLALFEGMARAFDPSAARAFEGRIVYELTRPATGAPTRFWTIEVSDRRAVARRGASEGAKLTLSFQLADFMRVAAGRLDPLVPVLQGRASVRGDFALATRLPQMFGSGH